MKEYSSYTTTDFLNDDLFLFWFYSREGDYYRKIIAEYPDREPYLKEAMEKLRKLDSKDYFLFFLALYLHGVSTFK